MHTPKIYYEKIMNVLKSLKVIFILKYIKLKKLSTVGLSKYRTCQLRYDYFYMKTAKPKKLNLKINSYCANLRTILSKLLSKFLVFSEAIRIIMEIINQWNYISLNIFQEGYHKKRN